jgi:hypothetical protein
LAARAAASAARILKKKHFVLLLRFCAVNRIVSAGCRLGAAALEL